MSIAVSPDERLIAIGGRGANEVTLWDIEENHPVTSFRVMTPWLCSMAFSADGRTLIGGCNSRDIKFWEVPTGEELGTLRLEQGASKVVLFPNHDNSLVSVSRDGAVRVWPVTSIVYVP
jgi:WD40 repeat protein